jgi:hypothetical protein
MGQGYSCNTYSIAMPYSGAALFILGTPQDTDGDGLTDAYERLVSHTDPSNPDTEGGLPDAWVAINGLTGSANLAGQDPDFDGLSNAQEYLYGTKPTVSEGFAIWVSGAATSSGVP